MIIVLILIVPEGLLRNRIHGILNLVGGCWRAWRLEPSPYDLLFLIVAEIGLGAVTAGV